jgi:hypothetical protein
MNHKPPSRCCRTGRVHGRDIDVQGAQTRYPRVNICSERTANLTTSEYSSTHQHPCPTSSSVSKGSRRQVRARGSCRSTVHDSGTDYYDTPCSNEGSSELPHVHQAAPHLDDAMPPTSSPHQPHNRALSASTVASPSSYTDTQVPSATRPSRT